MKTGNVYILECPDGSYYTGVSSNPDLRIQQHKLGFIKGYTHSRRPVKLVYCSEEMDIFSAIENEKRIKGWRRAKKKALIDGNFELLIELSKSYSKKNHDLHK